MTTNSACAQLARVLAMESEMSFPDYAAQLTEFCVNWRVSAAGTVYDQTTRLAREALRQDGLV